MNVPQELVEPEGYPVIHAMRRYGNAAAVLAGVGVCLLVLGSSRRQGFGATARAVSLGVLVGLGVKNLSELNDIIAETLLPQ